MDTLILIIILLTLVGGVVLLVKYAKKANRIKVELNMALANKLGLTYSLRKKGISKLCSLDGTRNGLPISIHEKIVGSGKNQRMFTAVSFSPSPFNFEFSISKEHFFSKIGKNIGFKDIEFDNFEFDKKFLLKSKQEDQFRQLLDYNMQHKLTGIYNVMKGQILSNSTEFSYTIPGGFAKQENVDDFEKVLAFMEALIQSKK